MCSGKKNEIPGAGGGVSRVTLHSENVPDIFQAEHLLRSALGIDTTVTDHVQIIAVVRRQPEIVDHQQSVLPGLLQIDPKNSYQNR